MSDLLLLFILATGTSLPFMLCLAALLRRDTGSEYRLAAMLAAGLGITNSYLSLIWLEREQGRALLLALQPLVIYGLGPCIWLLIRSFLQAGFVPRRQHLLHFLPALLVTAGFAVVLARGQVTQTLVPQAGSPLFLPFVGGFLLAIAYVLYTLRFLWRLYREDSETPAGESAAQSLRRAFLLFCAGGLIVLLVSLAGILAAARFSPLPPVVLTTLLLVVLFGVYSRNPALFQAIREAIEEARYRRCLLTDSLAGEIGQRLDALMTQQHLYRQSDLSLPALAVAVGVSPHQLSEYLNQHRGLGFARYVARYRVAAAQELLLKHPSRPVLDIALEAGFSSKSTFNTAFAEQAGMTPSAWRRSRKSTS
ncbi:MAG: helix-turn-helix domain-containing protein [Pseudomonadota bacterium]